MSQTKSLVACSLLTLMIFAASCQLALATTVQFTVPAGRDEVKTLQLVKDDHVVIKFDVTGTVENLLDFVLIDPHGNAKVSFPNTADVDYSFVCNDEGNYTMHFSNAGSEEAKLVTMDYEIQHYIFGIPQMLLLTLVIVMFCMAAVAVFVLMSRPPH